MKKALVVLCHNHVDMTKKFMRWLSIEEESAYHYSHQSMTNALQSWNHEIGRAHV